MPVIVSAVGAGLSVLVVALIAQWASRPGAVAMDPEPVERWFVSHLSRRRGARRVVHAFDRHVWGGAMVGIGLSAVLIGGAFVGWIFTTIDEDSGFARFDAWAAEWGAENATSASTDVLRGITRLGDTVLLLAAMAIVGLLVMWRRPGANWAIVGFLVTVGLGVSLVNNALKWMIMRDRPDIDQLAGSGGSSFPSGHTAAAAACWAAIGFVVAARMRLGPRRWIAAMSIAIAVLVAASRVLLGVHWLTDVIAGAVVGWTWFFVVALIFGGRLHRFGEPVERVPSSPVDEPVAHGAQS